MDDRARTRWSAERTSGASAYDDRWKELAAQGKNVHGEADFVSSLGVDGPVLDAGCGTGRVAIELARRGFEVVGVDLDRPMLDQARVKAPDLEWVESDLAALDLGPRRFGIAVLAGNVMIFLGAGTEASVVSRIAAHLRPGALLVAGFQLQPGRLDLPTYDRHAEAAGLRLRERWATWDRDPYVGGDYAVSVHSLSI